MSLQAAKPRMRPVNGGKSWAPTQDSFINPFTRTGFGPGSGNISQGGRFDPNTISRNRMELEWAYRGNWVARTIIDAPAEDMTRMGVDLQDEGDPKEVEQVHKEAERLRIWTALCRAEKWARLYGGALAYIMIDGQDPAQPLDLDTIGKDQFKGVMPLDRWMVWPITTDIVTELGPNFGLPKYYKLWPDVGTGLPVTLIHYTRVIRLDGEELPYWQRIAENYWGLSCLEPLWDRIMAFDSATAGAAQLVYKSYLRIVKIEDLRDALGNNQVMEEVIGKFFNMVRLLQSNEGITLLDKKDEFEAQTYTFAGIPDIIMSFGQQICGGSKIPAVRFFGQSPVGLNATGESDWRNYYDGIHAAQETRFRPGVETIYSCLYRSKFGRKPKGTLTIKFAPLWQLSDDQSAEVASKLATAIATLMDKGVFGPGLALKELKQSSNVTNFGSNISDDDIAAAEKQDKELREHPPLPLAAATGPAGPQSENSNVRPFTKKASGSSERKSSDTAL